MMLSGECDSQVCHDRVKLFAIFALVRVIAVLLLSVTMCLVRQWASVLSSRPSCSLALSLVAASVVFHLQINLNFRSMEMCNL